MTHDESPTARALLALELIQASPGITGARLGERLGVSDRAGRRYVAILREAGIPIESTPGRDGGYRLGRGFRLPPLMFSTGEAIALVMAVLEGGHRAADASDPVGGAINKIIRVLPAPVAKPVDALRQVGPRVIDGRTTVASPETTAVLVQACAAGRRLRLGYRRPAGEKRAIEVDPWGLAIRHGRWYLLCWSHTVDAKRVLRVDRVETVDVLPDTFVPPPDLDPDRAVADHLAEGRRYEVEVHIDAPLAAVMEWIPPNIGRLDAVDDDHTTLIGTTDDPSWYIPRLLAIHAPYRIVRPQELRDAAETFGERLVRAGKGSARLE